MQCAMQPAATAPAVAHSVPLLRLLPHRSLPPQIWYLPDGMRCFQDPTEVEWIEDKLWSNRLDEGWDLQQVRACA